MSTRTGDRASPDRRLRLEDVRGATDADLREIIAEDVKRLTPAAAKYVVGRLLNSFWGFRRSGSGRLDPVDAMEAWRAYWGPTALYQVLECPASLEWDAVRARRVLGDPRAG